MEKYTITKEQILEMASWANLYNLGQIIEWFPEAFKKELEVGVWYMYGRSLLNYQGLNNRDLIQAYGFLWDKSWMKTSNFGCNFKEWREATDEEVKEALKNEVIKRFGKDWETAKIDKCLVHGDTNRDFTILITTFQIWNKYGCIYENGFFAEPLKSKVISVEEAEKIISEKYGQKVEIK